MVEYMGKTSDKHNIGRDNDNKTYQEKFSTVKKWIGSTNFHGVHREKFYVE